MHLAQAVDPSQLVCIGVSLVVLFILKIIGHERFGRWLGNYISLPKPHLSAVLRSNYEPKIYLMSQAERDFYHVLRQALPPEHYQIFTKVRMWDIVDARKDLNRSEKQSAQNKIDRKHVDFVLCDPNDTRVYAVVELDDASHQRQDRIKSDEFKNETFGACGIPVVRFRVQPSYRIDEVAAHINSVLHPPATP